MNCQNIQVFKIETKYFKSCFSILQMTVLNISENSLKSTCSGALVAVSEFIGNFQFSQLFMVVWRKLVGGQPILKVNLSIIGCDGHLMRYMALWGGCIVSHSLLMMVNLFLHDNLMYSLINFLLNIQLSTKLNMSQHSKRRSQQNSD